MNFVDKAITFFSPTLGIKRQKARDFLEKRSYEAASTKRRVSDWKTLNSSANTEIRQALVTVRNRAREMRRNNPYASKIIQGISSNVIGTGILPSTMDEKFLNLYSEWANSTDCDANGTLNFYGLQKLCFESLVESGEVLVIRQFDKSKSVPLRLKVIESDYLDHSKNDPAKNLIQGVQFDNFGSVSGYWIFQNHPGESTSQSKFVSVKDVIHLYRVDRPGQCRGISWLAPIIIPLKKLADFEDAILEKQLISNLFAGFIYDTTDNVAGMTQQLSLEPGSLINLTAGKQIEFSDPPQPQGIESFLNHSLRSIACGVGIPFEILTGNLSEVNFSSARISWGEFQRSIDDWRWNTFIPQFLDKVWLWSFEAMTLVGLYSADTVPHVEWTPPRRVMVDIAREVPAITQMIRAGLITPSEAIREQGYNPPDFFQEYANDLKTLDELGIVLESDTRKDSDRKGLVKE